MKPEEITLIAGLGGTFIGVLSSIITTWITKYYENKEHYRSLLMEATIKDYEISKEILLKNGKGSLASFDQYLLHHAKFLNPIVDNKMTTEEVKKAIKEADPISKIFKTPADKS